MVHYLDMPASGKAKALNFQPFFDAIWGEKWSKSWRAICEAELGSLVEMEEAVGAKKYCNNTTKVFSFYHFLN